MPAAGESGGVGRLPEILVNLRRIGAIEDALGEQDCRQDIRRIVEPGSSKASVPAVRASRDAIWTVFDHDAKAIAPSPTWPQDVSSSLPLCGR